ncbi:hypothetical protein RGQ13_08625 [Thalassotalea psychrophila]|uniref:Uncharacterized protein n=1 Tax=Thalassotalea psychrophila TaxID=3065647 RepID=A0ABY9TZL6_9GAMM|nr:hypothetical protein RGQ13_08625 [Colwelliaceae bacterium SQ149]
MSIYKQVQAERWTKIIKPIMNLTHFTFKERVLLSSLVNLEDFSIAKNDGDFIVYLTSLSRELGLPTKEVVELLRSLDEEEAIHIINDKDSGKFQIEFTDELSKDIAHVLQ